MLRLGVCVLLLCTCVPCACNVVPSRDPTGEPLPAAEGWTLAHEPITLAGVLDGMPAVLFVPYTSDAQLDADRWSLGLHQLGTPVRTFELGIVPSTAGVLLAPVIDHSRRQQRAEVTWPTTLTFTGDSADRLATQTGMGRAQFSRVLLVDGHGVIVWFSDEGYTTDRMAALDAAARRVVGSPRS